MQFWLQGYFLARCENQLDQFFLIWMGDKQKRHGFISAYQRDSIIVATFDESNGIFVLGDVFSLDKFRLLTRSF